MAQALDWRMIVQALPLLAALPARLRPALALRRARKGEAIFRRGDFPRSMFAVLAGEVRLLRVSSSGTDVILQRARHGLLAEASLDQPRYHCDAVAAVTSDLASVPRSVFREALRDEAFRTLWTEQLLRELRRVRAQYERLCLPTAAARIVHFVESEGENGRAVLTQTKKAWAAEIGLTHEALYRALSRMQRAGTLRVDGAALVLVARPV